jgi:hypothetical protein
MVIFDDPATYPGRVVTSSVAFAVEVVNVYEMPADLPYKSDKLIAPLGTPANARTAASLRLIVAVDAFPNSTFTSARDIGPDTGSVMDYPFS